MTPRRSASAVAALAVSMGIVVTASPAQASPAVARIASADRYATSAAISAASFSPGVPVAYVATGTGFADGLAGGAAAARDGGPLLLVQPDAIPDPIATELGRLHPGHIVILGGTASVSTRVQNTLKGYTAGMVTRVAGSDRYATAATIAEGFPAGSPVYLVSGENFPDALVASAAAAAKHAAILLTRPTTLPAATAAALRQLDPSRITIVGGSAAVGPAVMQSLVTTYQFPAASVQQWDGGDRYETSMWLGTYTFTDATGAFLASGDSYADALSGGPVAGARQSPLLLVRKDCIPFHTLEWVRGLTSVTLLGGSDTLGDGVASMTMCTSPLPCLASTGSRSPSTQPAGHRHCANPARCRCHDGGALQDDNHDNDPDRRPVRSREHHLHRRRRRLHRAGRRHRLPRWPPVELRSDIHAGRRVRLPGGGNGNGCDLARSCDGVLPGAAGLAEPRPIGTDPSLANPLDRRVLCISGIVKEWSHWQPIAEGARAR